MASTASTRAGVDRPSPATKMVDAGILPPAASVMATMNRYPGGKNAEGTFQWLIGLMPTHAVYVEACVGSGALLRRKIPAPCSIVIDSDARVAEYWRQRAFPGTIVVEGDAVRWLADHAGEFSSDTLVYIDPPYRLDTRSKRRQYAEEWADGKHRDLLELVVRLPAHVMLSGYSTPEYSLRLVDWHREERRVRTRGGTWATEVVWCNFEPGATTARGEWDRKTPGSNFRERERIKKKLRRWDELYLRMPPDERRAFLMRLIEREAAQHAAGVEGRSTQENDGK